MMRGLVIALCLLAATANAQRNLLMEWWARTPIGSATFTPLSLAPKVWLDASDTSTLTLTNTVVSKWADKSGNGFNATQATYSKMPAYSNTAFNASKAGVVFNGASVMLFTNLVVGATNYTAFLAIETTRSDLGGSKYVFDAQAGRLILMSFNNQTPASAYAYYTDSDLYQNTTIPVNTNGIKVLTWGLSSAARVYLDGTLISTNAYTKKAIGGSVAFGARYSADQTFLYGNVGEFILYGYSLSDSERQSVQAYLKAKWGTP